MSNEGKRKGGRAGAGRRVYPLDSAPPRVGRVAKDVPPAERVDAAGEARFAQDSMENRGSWDHGGSRGKGGFDRRGGTHGGSRESGNFYNARGREDGVRSGERPEAEKPDRRFRDFRGGGRRDFREAPDIADPRKRDAMRDGGGRHDLREVSDIADPKKRNAMRDGGGRRDLREAPDIADPKKRDAMRDGGGRRDLREVSDIADPKKRNAVRNAQRPQPAPVEPLPEDGHLLCGRNPIREALRAGRPVEKLLVASGDLSGAAHDIVQLAREAGAVVQRVDRSRLDQIYPAHQGMIAYVAAVEYSTVDEMLERAAQRGEEPLLVLLDGITDPHNLGAIVRTAECVGAHGVILPERRSAGLTPAAAKAAAGALNYMPVARVTNLNRTIDELKARGVWIVGASMDGVSAFSADLSGPMALVVGSEGEGISRLTLEKCDLRVAIPMKGHIDSLNASVAAGVLMYAIARARA